MTAMATATSRLGSRAWPERKAGAALAPETNTAMKPAGSATSWPSRVLQRLALGSLGVMTWTKMAEPRLGTSPGVMGSDPERADGAEDDGGGDRWHDPVRER